MPVRIINGIEMKSINDVHNQTGFSIANIRKYKDMGLISAVTTQQGSLTCVWFDDTSIFRLKLIKIFREMDVPLKEIQETFDKPDVDQNALLDQMIAKLEKRRDEIDRKIEFCKTSKTFGVKGFALLAAANGGIDTYMKQVGDFMQSRLPSVDKDALGKIVETSIIPKLDSLRELMKFPPTSDAAQQFTEALIDGFYPLLFCLFSEDSSAKTISSGERIMTVCTLVYIILSKGDLTNIFIQYAGEESIAYISKAAIYSGVRAAVKIASDFMREYNHCSTDLDKDAYIRVSWHKVVDWLSQYSFNPNSVIDMDGEDEIVKVAQEMMSEVELEELKELLDPEVADSIYNEIVQTWNKLPL